MVFVILPRLRLRKVISGGQTGADIGGLKAARKARLMTGGWAPKGWRTLAGPNPALGSEFNLKEDDDTSYAPRTGKNVRDSDGTIRFARKWDSPGEILTKREADEQKKPLFDVDVTKPPTIPEVVAWLGEHRILVLNVAGNAETTAPGTEEFVQTFLASVFAAVEPEPRYLTFSASQFESYDRCERRWWFDRVAKLPTMSSSAQELGVRFAEVLERYLLRQDPFPSGWDEGLYPVERDLCERLWKKATTPPGPGKLPLLTPETAKHVEAEFWMEVLPAEGNLPRVRLLGYIDVVTPDGIDDHKMIKSMRWAKSGDDLRQNIQLQIYGEAWLQDRRSDKLPDPPVVELRHHYYVKDVQNPYVETRRAEPPLTPAELDRLWGERVEKAREMRLLHVQRKPKDDLETEKSWATIPASGTVSDAQSKRGGTPCGDYGGCAFAGICGGGESPAAYRAMTLRKMENAERKARGLPEIKEEQTLDLSAIFGGRQAATSVETATNGKAPAAAPGVQTAPSTAPGVQTAPSTPPGVTMGVPGLPPPPPAAGTAAPPPASTSIVPPANAPVPAASWATPSPPKTKPLFPNAPSWTYPDCGACVIKVDGVDYVTGVTFKKGDPCRICNGRARGIGKLYADLYDTYYVVGANGPEFIWEVRREHVDRVEKEDGGRAGGALVLPWMKENPPKDPNASEVAAPPPAAAATAPPPPAAAATAPLPAMVVISSGTSAGTAPEVTIGKKKHKFTLLVDAHGSGTSVRLDEVYGRHVAALAAFKGVAHFTLIPEAERRSMIALTSEKLIDDEKWGTKYVLATRRSFDQDYLAFLEVVQRYAAEMIEGVR